MTEPAPEALLAAGTAFLDVRSPGEFARGTVPGAVNLPLLDDDERHRVGLTYKRSGHDAAVALGHRLVSGEQRALRLRAWQSFAREHPGSWIYCWRGGERSAIAQRWLADAGIALPRLCGGFKALRHACLAVLERAPAEKRWVVLGGRTGSGKTGLLARLDNAIDLEGLACHRGSAFGAQEAPQPTPVTFDALLAVAFLRHAARHLVVEDESRTIGRLALPEGWHAHMQTVPLVLLEVPLEQRVANIVREYVDEPLAHGLDAGDLQSRYVDALGRIERRLGGQRCRAVRDALHDAFQHGNHEAWVEPLLRWYYDPMYDHQLERKRTRVVFRGCAEAALGYLGTLAALR